MEWLKKTGRGLKKAGKFAGKHAPDVAEVVLPPVVGKLMENHGDKIDGAVGKVDQIADKLSDGIISQEQADRIEKKIDLLLSQQADHITQTDRTERKVDKVLDWIDSQRRLGDRE